MAMDKCARCGFEDVIDKNVDKVLWGGDDAAVVNVPVEVCLHCGERFYGPGTVFLFDRIRKMLRDGAVEDFKPIGRYFRVPDSFNDGSVPDLASLLNEQTGL